MFLQATGVQCKNCHRVGTDGNVMALDVGSASQLWSRRLLDAVVARPIGGLGAFFLAVRHLPRAGRHILRVVDDVDFFDVPAGMLVAPGVSMTSSSRAPIGIWSPSRTSVSTQRRPSRASYSVSMMAS